MPDADTVVFIPAWNEAKSIPAVLEDLRTGLPEADVLVIDDGSTDRTAEVAAAMGATVVSFGENRGLRAGIAAGYREADERGYAYCGRVDADGQHPVDELLRLLALVRGDECDVAVGSRFAEAEGYSADRYLPSPSRRFGIGLLQKAMHVRLGKPFRDPTSGMAVVNRKAMPIMAQPYTSGAPEVEALLRLRQAGLQGAGGGGEHARPLARRVEAPGQQGREARAHRHRNARLLRLVAAPTLVSRVIVVLGYSDGGRGELHEECAARLDRAAEVSTSDDVVVLSGWARVRGTQSEAELMRAAWRGVAGELVVDPDARTTVGNMANAVNDILRVGAREVVVVTSSWHAPRAKAALRWLLRYTGVNVRAETTPRRSVRSSARELLVWPLLPFQLWEAGRKTWQV